MRCDGAPKSKMVFPFGDDRCFLPNPMFRTCESVLIQAAASAPRDIMTAHLIAMDLLLHKGGADMKLIIDLGGRQVEEVHPSEKEAREHLSTVLTSHQTRGHRIARESNEAAQEPRYVVQTPEGRLAYWLER